MPDLEVSKNELYLRSDEIKDIMSRSPMWVVKWGISVIFIILLLGILMSWFMKYPDIIKGPVTVTHINPPVRVVSQASGNLVTLYVQEGDTVKEGELLAEIQNPLSASAVEDIKMYINELERNISAGMPKLPLLSSHTGKLGDLQSVMNSLETSIRDYNLRSAYRIDNREISGLISQLENELKLEVLNDNVLKLAQADYDNAKIKYNSDKKLFDEGVLSQSDFIQLQSLYNQKQMQLEQAKQASVQSKININSLETRMAQMRYSKESKDRSGYGDIIGYVESIRSYLYGWRQKFTLVAPVSGKLSFVKHLREGIHIKYDEPLFALIKQDDIYVAHGYVLAAGAGKVKVGQNVNVFLDNYPYHEFGVILGKVKYVADIPVENTYRVEIALPEGLKTTYGEELKSAPEMVGNIEIITDDKRVLQRIMNSITKIFESR